MTTSQSHTRSGFTLIEILIAAAIVAILGAVIAPAMFRFLSSSKMSATKGNLSTFKLLIQTYRDDTGELPERLRDLAKKPSNPEVAAKWNGPYTEKSEIPTDGWGAPFQYKPTPGGEHPYELYSYGPNGKGSPKSEWIDVWSL